MAKASIRLHLKKHIQLADASVEFDEDKVTEKILKTLEWRASPELVRINPPCLDYLYFQYHYPLCWFRSFVQCMLFSPKFRDYLQTIENTSGDPILTKVLEYLKAHANYISEIETPLQQDWHALYKFPNSNIYFDDLMCYFMYLLNKFNAEKFPVKRIQGYYGRRYMLRFFDLVFRKFNSSLEGITILNIKGNKNLIYNSSEQTSDSSIPFIIADYGKFLDNMSPNSEINKLALYINHNGVRFSLQSVMVTSIFDTSSLTKVYKSLFRGHQFCIYRCNDKYLSSENMFNETSINLHLADVHLLENMLVNNGRIPSDHGSKYDLTFNANKCVKVGIYMPCNLHITEKELLYLEELGTFINTATINTETYMISFPWSARCMALLIYFFRFFNFNLTDPSVLYRCLVSYSFLANTHVFIYRLIEGVLQSHEIRIRTDPIMYVETPKLDFFDIPKNDGIDFCISVIERTLNQVENPPSMITTKPSSMICRFPNMELTLSHMFDIVFKRKDKELTAASTSRTASNRVVPTSSSSS